MATRALSACTVCLENVFTWDRDQCLFPFECMRHSVHARCYETTATTGERCARCGARGRKDGRFGADLDAKRAETLKNVQFYYDVFARGPLRVSDDRMRNFFNVAFAGDTEDAKTPSSPPRAASSETTTPPKKRRRT